jgi:hypothetical protein
MKIFESDSKQGGVSEMKKKNLNTSKMRKRGATF